MTLGSNDIGIRKSEFVEKTQFLCQKKSNQKLTKIKYLFVHLFRVIMRDDMFFFSGIFTFLIPNVVRL